MIILRQKLFRRDNIDNKKIFKLDESLLKIYKKLTYNIEYSNQYNQDIKKLGYINKKLAKNLIKDIKSGYLYTDGPNGGDTHFLEDFSNKINNEETLVFSKCINNFDRLNYRIYKPKVIEYSKGKELIKLYSQKIVILSCKGHNIPGQGDYLHDKELRKRTRFKNRTKRS